MFVHNLDGIQHATGAVLAEDDGRKGSIADSPGNLEVRQLQVGPIAAVTYQDLALCS